MPRAGNLRPSANKLRCSGRSQWSLSAARCYTRFATDRCERRELPLKRDAEHIPFTDTGSYPIRAGNVVRALVDGVPAFQRICEAVDAARHSVWVTVAFYRPDFRMPDGRALWDVLDDAAGRGVDVRVIFWRHLGVEQIEPRTHFPGTAAERSMLRARSSRFLARWDQAHGTYCQHQKSWLIDAGRESEVAF